MGPPTSCRGAPEGRELERFELGAWLAEPAMVVRTGLHSQALIHIVGRTDRKVPM